jgi:hypothetical protein
MKNTLGIWMDCERNGNTWSEKRRLAMRKLWMRAIDDKTFGNTASETDFVVARDLWVGTWNRRMLITRGRKLGN